MRVTVFHISCHQVMACYVTIKIAHEVKRHLLYLLPGAYTLNHYVILAQLHCCCISTTMHCLTAAMKPT
jgi:hypothetical protein